MAENATPEFPEYSSKYSKVALESRQKLAPEMLPLVDQIERELADGPEFLKDRLIPASLEGTTYIYNHADSPVQITFQVDEEKKILYYFHFSAPALEVKKSVFISYSHADEDWLHLLKKFLGVLEQQGVIKFWDDSQIEAGEEWRQQIEEALDSAHAAVLLVSQDFLVSDFITKHELPKLLADAKAQGKKILWIPVSPSTVFESHKEITRFQSPLKNPRKSLEELGEAERKRAMVQVSSQLAKAVSG